MSRAFFVEGEEPFVPTPRQAQIVSRLADWVVRRRLTLPAVMSLESMQPLNYLGSQALVFFQPFITAFLDSESYKEFQQMLEHRDSLHFIVQCIEDTETKWNEQRKTKRTGTGGSPDPSLKE